MSGLSSIWPLQSLSSLSQISMPPFVGVHGPPLPELLVVVQPKMPHPPSPPKRPPPEPPAPPVAEPDEPEFCVSPGQLSQQNASVLQPVVPKAAKAETARTEKNAPRGLRSDFIATPPSRRDELPFACA